MLPVKNRFAFYILLSSVICISSVCKKENTDGFYFQCKVNGEEYIPNNCANCEVAQLLGDTVLLINGNKDFESILIGVIKLDGVPIKQEEYILNENPQQNASYKFSTTVDDQYKTDSTHTGILRITFLDKTNQIIEGNFHFDAYNSIQLKSVSVTEGEFRLNYRDY